MDGARPASPPPPIRIALLGAPGTGAAALATALRGHAALPPDRHAFILPALPDLEMAEGAKAEAAPRPPGWTAALETLRATGCAQAWLMGLDGMGLDGTPERPLPADERAHLERRDTALRALLRALAQPFHVLYGPPPDRLRQALALLGAPTDAAGPGNAMKNIANNSIFTATPRHSGTSMPPQPVWQCEKCSDPECEHQLFQRLIARPPG
ncbi:hypothetical protein [Paracidovorax anthurii]|uniref:Uncharacterized protein n=1 Tax=Paracidovorax anthurii TaxID=78229 RepID=A0A328ZE89_9BURK|nr:hypothetical protein [Paracidovorax anthurii]RAR82812.1 hypothetical protein AX018_101619 [Paracidovorax anthurii]